MNIKGGKGRGRQRKREAKEELAEPMWRHGHL